MKNKRTNIPFSRRHILLLGFLFCLSGFLLGCQEDPEDDELNGRITLWHSWPPTEFIVLEAALDEFQEIHPDVRITAVALPKEQLLDSLYDAGTDGLGPDLFLGQDSWIGELVENRVIRPLAKASTLEREMDYRNFALTRYNGKQYGLPLSLAPHALYYNKTIVTQPPTTLDELLAEAAAGHRVAFVPRFEEAYWGIQAFGEGLFDDQSNFTLTQSGFIEWLTWLDDAQRASGVILNIDDESLLELFVTGEIVYYVATPEKQTRIEAMLPEDTTFEYGVAPLPTGPNGLAGPLLPAETIMLYTHSSGNQAKIASELAIFLTNQQQSIRFMRDLSIVPANTAVQVDIRIYPNVFGFSQQAKTAVVIPNEIPSTPLKTAGDRAYVSVLSGILTPAEAVCRFGREVIAIEGYAPIKISLPEGCRLTN